MARSFDSGEGSCKRLGTASLDADDSQFCSAAVTGEDVGIGWEIGSLRIFSAASELASSEMRRD